MTQPQVLVVGAGPSGLLLALSLLKNGVSVRIIEKEEDNNVGDRGAGIMPRTIEIEHFLGIDKEVLEQGIQWPTMHIYNPADPHQVVRKFPIAEHYDPTPAFPTMTGVMLGQSLHQAILRKHLHAAGTDVEFNTSLINLKQDADGVKVEISKTEDGKETITHAKFAYVVGADGARSTVRKALEINFVGESRENVTVLLDAQLEGIPEGSAMHFWGDARKAVVSARTTCEPGTFHILFAGPETNVEVFRSHRYDPEIATQEFQRVSGRTDIKITKITVQSEWRPNIRMADRFSVGRVFIIGDAAHAHPPTGGQGLNTSVQDSYNLAWKLALASKGLASPALLDSYEAERMPVIAQLLNISTKLFDNIADAVSANTPAPPAPSAAALQAVKQAQKQNENESTWAKRRKLFQLDVNYRWSGVVVDERYADGDKEKGDAAEAYGEEGRAARAGDRAPDAPALKRIGGGGDAPTRLFDIFCPAAHTVLVFAAPTAGSAKIKELLTPFTSIGNLQGAFRVVVIQPKGSADPITGIDGQVYEDTEGHAYTGYGVPNGEAAPTVVIVRPDSWIGAFATSQKGVQAYVDAVFNAPA